MSDHKTMSEMAKLATLATLATTPKPTEPPTCRHCGYWDVIAHNELCDQCAEDHYA